MSQRQTRAPVLPHRLVQLVDLQLGLATRVVGRSSVLGHRIAGLTRPVRHGLASPVRAAVPPRAKNRIHALAAQGRHSRQDLVQASGRLLDVLAPFVVSELVRRLDLTDIVADHVDVDRILTRVDLDAAASRLDLNALVDGLDIDRVIMSIDLMDVVHRSLDLDALVASVDLDAAAARLDVDAAAARLDIDAAAARLDIDAVIGRVDLVALARDVIAQLDLPEIIRESTGSMASDTVRGARMQSISGDEALSRIIDRLSMRRSRRGHGDASPVAGPPPDLADSATAPPPVPTGTA
jgi:hypothetical protein